MNRGPACLLPALGSAFFAALTAVFGKLAVAELDPDLTTLLRTVVILVLTAGIVSWRAAAGGLLIAAGAVILAAGG